MGHGQVHGQVHQSHGQSHERLPIKPPPPPQNHIEEQYHYANNHDYYSVINNNRHITEVPTYEYIEQNNQRFYMSRSIGDIAGHEKQISSASHATMVVLPDQNFQSDHQRVIDDLVDSGLKTLNPKNIRRTSA